MNNVERMRVRRVLTAQWRLLPGRPVLHFIVFHLLSHLIRTAGDDQAELEKDKEQPAENEVGGALREEEE